MVDPYGEISFLTRSENRVTVLEVLAEGGYTERQLVQETGISDVTVKRILEDFEDRNWVRVADRTYRLSTVGELVADGYRELDEAVDLAARLGPVLDLLPVEEMDFDLGLLANGRVSDPGTFDSLRALDRWKELLEQSDRVVGTAPEPLATTVVADPFHEAVVNGDTTFRVVLSTAYYEAASARPEIREKLREMLRADAEMYLTPEAVGDFTANVAAFDDVATITAYDDAGNLRAGVESLADPVHEWVVATYESFRADATRLKPEDLTE
jgi:hypothetical protein